ncbi:MAG: OmpA family protein [Flavobacteriales bacterium]|nr:OmpA family protein [Flavobacteriales bacterium]
MTARSILSLVLVCAALIGRAQEALLRQGDLAFEAFSYAEAIEAYEQAFHRNANSIEHARRLGESYWNLRDTRNAERWYAIVAASSQATPIDLYRYAELLRVSGQYADSDLWLKRYGKLAPTDSRVRTKENAVQKLVALLEGDGITHKVVPVPFNSGYSDISPFILGDTLFFASSRVERFGSRHVHSWNAQPFLDLYTANINDTGAVVGITPLPKGLNTDYHESNAVLSPDGNTLFFTRNNVQNGRKVLSEEGINNLQIMVRTRQNGQWANERAFTYNSPSYSVGHPALSKDGRRLYFTSDMPGGIGGKDLYVCHLNDQGGWDAPVNLGAPINTEGDEMFPYVYNNILYFASDGHLGLGGLDLFRVTIRGEGFGLVENLNAPVNGPADDFGLCLDRTGDIAYFVSDRGDALGTENIYRFRMNSKPDEERKWRGRVLDIADAQPVPYLQVRMFDQYRNEIARTVTSAQGVYEFPAPNVPASVNARIPGGSHAELANNEIEVSLYGDTDVPDLFINSVMDLPVNAILKDAATDEWLEGVNVTVRDVRDGTLLFTGYTNEMGITQGQVPDRRYGDDLNLEVTFTKPGYLSKSMLIDFRVLMFLEQALVGPDGTSLSPISAGIDMAEAMNLRPIYFDFRDHRIRSDAAGELDLVAQVLRLDPSIRIELRSHTDSRASTEYNDALSERRAQSTRQYLLEQGISADRIVAKGFGERQLVNACTDGAECSEEEHQMNRRTEFIITGCKDCGEAVQKLKP